MNEPVTLQQVILTAIGTIIAALAPQLYNTYSRYKDSRDKKEELESAEEARQEERKLTETEKLYREWENVVNGYVKQIEFLRFLETENAQLRPLVLKIALIQQENKQLKEDKEDWKSYADKLARQLEEMGHVPIPFRRTPRDGDTKERIRAISQKIEKVSDEITQHNSMQTETLLKAVRRTGNTQPMSPVQPAPEPPSDETLNELPD